MLPNDPCDPEKEKMASLHPEAADSELTYRKTASPLAPADAGGGAAQPDDDDVDKRVPVTSRRDLTPFAPLDIPFKYRMVALVTILFYTTGAAFAESTLGPLKSTFVKELNINS